MSREATTTEQKKNQTAATDKADSATTKPVADVKGDELSETDVAKVTGGAYDAFKTPPSRHLNDPNTSGKD
ncbi:MAG TPA: hypothetical protein VJY39_11405 [Acidisphaera sp.]|nr:hypothetical protein [Acidisphaera sp.]HME28125.1 hypothetical protein [Acetobacteraceae bacterium]